MDTSSRFQALCTVTLIVLILSPFTAPFSTCAVDDLFAHDADRVVAMLVPPVSADAGAAADAKAALHATSTIPVSLLSMVDLDRRFAPPPRAGARQLSFTVIRV
jgi:hypothetical protein